MQGALFGRETPAFDATFGGSAFGGSAFGRGSGAIRRIELTEGAWLEHLPGWLEGHAHVFRELAQNADWQSQRRQMYEREVEVPRLVARAPLEGRLGELLRALSQALGRRYQRPLESITLAQYRSGSDSVAFHGDKVGRLASDCVVASVSVGAPRRFAMRPIGGGASLSFELGWGDLLVMGGTCQRSWQHAVPKRAHADPRISILFRPRSVG